ncbi:MAG: aminoacetone oxidase family FAD-binding enzyme [Bacilli bacterium]
MYDIVIIGAGASGLLCASNIIKNNSSLKVCLLEKNDKIGKKVLITGNGRCNLGNANVLLNNYSSNSSLKRFEKELISSSYLDFFKEIGLITKHIGDKLYPYSMQASTVVEVLEKSVKANVEIINNFIVKRIIKKDDIFIINNEIKAKKIIVATGGKSYPKTGSTGDGYNLLKSFGHKITCLYPSLVALNLAFVSGVRFDGNVSLIINDNVIKAETGQIQFNKDNISGICVFNISRDVKKYLNDGKMVFINIDIMPEYDASSLKKYLKKFPEETVYNFLTGIINNKLAKLITKENNLSQIIIKQLDEEKTNSLINKVHGLKFQIIDTLNFDSAQVTSGGVCIDEFTDNLESKIVDNLFVIGELLDVDGACGGYNLNFAFTTAMIVSKYVSKEF